MRPVVFLRKSMLQKVVDRKKQPGKSWLWSVAPWDKVRSFSEMPV